MKSLGQRKPSFGCKSTHLDFRNCLKALKSIKKYFVHTVGSLWVTKCLIWTIEVLVWSQTGSRKHQKLQKSHERAYVAWWLTKGIIWILVILIWLQNGLFGLQNYHKIRKELAPDTRDSVFTPINGLFWHQELSLHAKGLILLPLLLIKQ